MTTATMTAPPSSRRDSRPVAIWLFVMCALVAVMVAVGGATRLTESGLSITEWKPVTGALPPLSEAAWHEEFEKYRQIPQYQLVNRGMSLEAFKRIYWWEWAHRFLGRLIGLAFLAPMLVFLATGRIDRRLGLKLAGVFALGAAQGALGWYMVQSGLTERISVSQYRLAAHLGLALALFGAMFWIGLDLIRPRNGARHPLFWGATALACGVYLQMILGAFVAGLRAGKTYNTWPLMSGQIVPDGYFLNGPRFADLFESVAAVQFNHRIGAYLLVVGALWFWAAARRTTLGAPARLLAIAVMAQMALGIWTVLAATPLSLGLLHQAGALVVFAAALYAVHSTGR
jgi:cytochrome c oxidase assembly protein subunit 15